MLSCTQGHGLLTILQRIAQHPAEPAAALSVTAAGLTACPVVSPVVSPVQVGLLDIDICGPSAPKLTGLEGEEVHQSGSGWSPVYVQDNLAVMSIGASMSSLRTTPLPAVEYCQVTLAVAAVSSLVAAPDRHTGLLGGARAHINYLT